MPAAQLVAQVGIEPGPELRAPAGGDAAPGPRARRRSSRPSFRRSSTRRRRCSAATPICSWLHELWRDARARLRERRSSSRAPRGIGKTRLAAALAAEAHRDRAFVLYASGAGRRTPRWPRSSACARRGARRCWCSTTSTAPARRSRTRCVGDLRGAPGDAGGSRASWSPARRRRAAPRTARRRRRARRRRALRRHPSGRRTGRAPDRSRAAACRSASTAPRASGRAQRPPGG